MKRNSALLSFIADLVALAYERIFNEKATAEAKDFLKTLSYVVPVMAFAGLASLAFDVLAGKVLGPGGYGEFALAQSVAMFLYLPMLLGFNTAMVKYNVEADDVERQSKIISATYILVAMFTLVSVGLLYFFSAQLSNVFSVSQKLFHLAIVFAILFVLYTLATSTLQSLFKMKTYVIFQMVCAAILLSSFVVFILSGLYSFEYAVYSMYLAYGATGTVLLVFFLRGYFKFGFDKSWANILTRYSLLAVGGGVAFALYINIDKILLNKYMAISDVGIYRAYYLTSIYVAMSLFTIFNVVFFPTVSKYENKGPVFKRLNKLMPYLGGVGLPAMVICQFVFLKFYGVRYPFNLGLSVLFGLAAVIMFINGCYAWLMVSLGERGVRVAVLCAAVCAAVNVALNIVLIPLVGIAGAVVALIAGYLAYTALLLSQRRLLLAG